MRTEHEQFALDFANAVIKKENVPKCYYWSDGEILCPSCFDQLYGDGEDTFNQCDESDEEDSSIVCDDCGCWLSQSLTGYGVESEIADFTGDNGDVEYGHGSYPMALLVHDGIAYYNNRDAALIGWLEARAWYAVE